MTEQAAAAGRAGAVRLAGVDLARAVALLGMAATHVFPARGPDGDDTLAHAVFSGRSSALFAVLAGVGLALLSGGQRPVRGAARARASRSVVLRCLCIALVGLLLGELDSGVAVILAYYGVLFLAALPVLGLGPRPLAALSLGAAVGVPPLLQVVRDGMVRLGGNPRLELVLTSPRDLLETLLVTGYYPVLAWTAYLFAGLAVGRLPLRQPRTAVALVVGGGLLAVVASAVSAALLRAGGLRALAAVTDVPDGRTLEQVVSGNQFGDVPTTTWWWLAVDAPHATTPLDLLHTTGTALAALGVALLVARALPPLAGEPLVALGAMTLTLYSAHVVVLALTDGEDPAALYWWQVAGAAAFAVLWRRGVGPRGPLEAVVAAVARRDATRLPPHRS